MVYSHKNQDKLFSSFYAAFLGQIFSKVLLNALLSSQLLYPMAQPRHSNGLLEQKEYWLVVPKLVLNHLTKEDFQKKEMRAECSFFWWQPVSLYTDLNQPRPASWGCLHTWWLQDPAILSGLFSFLTLTAGENHFAIFSLKWWWC